MHLAAIDRDPIRPYPALPDQRAKLAVRDDKAQQLLSSLESTALPKNREEEAEKAKARAALRFAR